MYLGDFENYLSRELSVKKIILFNPKMKFRRERSKLQSILNGLIRKSPGETCPNSEQCTKKQAVDCRRVHESSVCTSDRPHMNNKTSQYPRDDYKYCNFPLSV